MVTNEGVNSLGIFRVCFFACLFLVLSGCGGRDFNRIFFYPTYKKPLKIKGWKENSRLGGMATQQRPTSSKYLVAPHLAW